MKVNVTEEDIAFGNHGAFSCPIARALSRTFQQSVGVGSKFMIVGKAGTYRELPKEVVEFIYRFDSDEEVKPFEFEVD